MFRRILSPRQNRSQSSGAVGTIQLANNLAAPGGEGTGGEEIKNLSYGDPDKLNSPVRSQSMVATPTGEMNPPLPPRNMRPSSFGHQDSESALYVAPADTLRKPTVVSSQSPSGAGTSHSSAINVEVPVDAPTRNERKVMQMHQLTMKQKAGVTPASASNGHHTFGNVTVTENSEYSVPFNLVQGNERNRAPLKPPRVVRPERHDSSDRIIPINPPLATSPQPPSDRSNTNSPSSPLSNQSSEQDPPPGPPPPRQDNGSSDYAEPWDRSKFLQNIPHNRNMRKPPRRKNDESGISEESSGSSVTPHRPHREDVQLHQHVDTKLRSASVREPSPPLPARVGFRFQSAREPERESSSPPPPELPFDPRPHRNRAVSDRIHRREGREGSTSPVGGAGGLRSRVEDMGFHSQSVGPYRGHNLPNPPPPRFDHAYPPPPPREQSTAKEDWRYCGGPPDSVYIDVSIPLEDQPWYHGHVTRAEAEEILRDRPDFSFLVRKSESCQTDYSLSIRDTSGSAGFFHLRLVFEREPRPGYVLGQFSNHFDNVTECIANYTKQRLNIRGAEHKRLKYPVARSAPLERGHNFSTMVGV